MSTVGVAAAAAAAAVGLPGLIVAGGALAADVELRPDVVAGTDAGVDALPF